LLADLHPDPTPLFSVDFPYGIYSLPTFGYTAGVSDCWLSLQPPAYARSPLEDFSTLKMEAINSSETSVNPGSTQRHNPENDILHSHRCEKFKSYIYIPRFVKTGSHSGNIKVITMTIGDVVAVVLLILIQRNYGACC
jgi:hypothetical protein